MGPWMETEVELTDEMREAIAAEIHANARLDVRRSVAFIRRTTGATGNPETLDQSAKVHMGNRMVPDPMMTDAEFLHQKASNPTKPNIGRVHVQENALSRMGALCYIRSRLRHHEMAAEQFKSLYEARYGSGNPAMDPARIQVDTSPIAHDSGMAGKIDRTWKLRQAETDLGKPTFDRLIALCVLCIPCGEGAPTMPSGRPNDRWVRQSVETALDDLDRLSAVWGFKAKAA